MGLPHFEVPVGAVDGVNTVYKVSFPYKPGTTAVWLNGLLLSPTLDDGWVESDPDSGEITMKEAPTSLRFPPDVIQVFYQDLLDDPIQVFVENLVGVLVEESETLAGVLLPSASELHGALDVEEVRVEAVISTSAVPLSGTLETMDELLAVLSEGC